MQCINGEVETHTNKIDVVWKDIKDHFRKKVRYENFSLQVTWRRSCGGLTSNATTTKDSSLSWEQLTIQEVLLTTTFPCIFSTLWSAWLIFQSQLNSWEMKLGLLFGIIWNFTFLWIFHFVISLFRMHFSANTDGKSDSGASEDESRSPHQATSLLTELSFLEVGKRRTRASDSLKNLMHELFFSKRGFLRGSW